MDRERFDALTRVLGAGASRRGALGALAGLIGLGLGDPPAAAKRRGKRRHAARRKQDRVRAQAKGGNKACARFCQAVFPPGPERDRCVGDAAQGAGLCQECGVDPTRACRQLDGSVRCCAADRTCDEVTGACACADASPCPDLKSRNPDTCACECRVDLPACEGGKTRNPGTCACECPATVPPCTFGRDPGTCACTCPPFEGHAACLARTCSPEPTIDGCDVCVTGLTCDACASSAECPGGLCVLGCNTGSGPIPVCAAPC